MEGLEVSQIMTCTIFFCFSYSGMAPHGTVQVNVLFSSINGLPSHEVTVAEVVKTSSIANYSTSIIGKEKTDGSWLDM